MNRNPIELFRKFFGAVRGSFWPCESLLAPDDLSCWEPPDVGLAPTGVWRVPLIPHCN